MQKLGRLLKVETIFTTIGCSVLVGSLVCANSKGIILPPIVREEELEPIRAAAKEANVTLMDTKRTAYGNMVLANDYGAIVDPRLKQETIGQISETLDVEVVQGEIGGLPYVGSLATATNKGVLVHPLIKEEEQELLKNVLRVPLDVGTVNCGIPYVGTGLLGNSYGAVAGLLTTGPELFIIGNALDVVKEDE